MARDGLGIVFGAVFSAVFLIIGTFITPYLLVKIMAAVGVIFALFVLNFFRDPDRPLPDGEANIISPADGKVVEIIEEYEADFFDKKITRISIFMNVFDVHVNRIPISGTVSHFKYKKGSFKNAYQSAASEVNEQTIIGITNGKRKLLFKQIAGLIARRIVCHVREAQYVQIGERFGLIKFGSRIDLLLPDDVEIKVKLNQKVKSGQSIIGVFRDEI